MRLRALLLFFAFWFLAVSSLSAQHSPEPTQARLATVAHLAALTQSDFKALSAQAQSGEPEAQYWLAQVYQQGRLVPKDSTQSESWLFKSAEQGYPPAEEIVGRMCLSGVHRDPRKAEMWLRRAAVHGNSEAQFWLGAAYEQGSELCLGRRVVSESSGACPRLGGSRPRAKQLRPALHGRSWGP